MNNYRKYIGFIGAVVLLIIVFFSIRGLQISNTKSGLMTEPIDGGYYTEPITFKGEQYLVPVQDIVETGVDTEDIPALVNPKMDPVALADSYLDDSVYGIDVEVKGEHFFYSYQIMNWHRLVSDTVNGEKLLITHCPFCRSPRAYKTSESFTPSTQVYNANILMTDEDTGSLWTQFDGTAITGDRIGETLESYPVTILKWEDWKLIYPDGMALSDDTGYERDYSRHPYLDYDVNKTKYFPLNNADGRLSDKWLVDGTHLNGDSAAWSKTIMKGMGVENAELGGEKIVAMYENISGITRVFLSTLDDGTELTFEYDFDDNQFTDTETRSIWDAHGNAVKGELAGTQLDEIPSHESFWMCWTAHYPDTLLGNFDLAPSLDEDGNKE